jgi:YihY family inner membrane protein
MAARAQASQKPRLSGSGFLELAKATWAEFNEDKVPRLGAALAYYTIFSLAPLLIIVIAVAGLVFGQGQAQEALLGQLRGLLGSQGADMIQTMIDSTRRPAAGLFATVFGLGTLVLAAIGAFNQLHDALNTIWEVKPKPHLGWLQKVRDRLLSFGMVLFVGFLLMVSLAVSAALGAAGAFMSAQLPFVAAWILNVVNFAISFAVITLLRADVQVHAGCQDRLERRLDRGCHHRPAVHGGQGAHRAVPGPVDDGRGLWGRRGPGDPAVVDLLLGPNFSARGGIYAGVCHPLWAARSAR